MKRILTHLAKDTKGATAVEYGLILALVFLSMAGSLALFGDEAIGMWDDVSDEVEGAREEAS